MSASDDGDRIPVTVFSGYLGAGKTTLVNHLLANPGDREIVVVVHDMGEINIDAQLLASDVDRHFVWSLIDHCFH